MVAQPLVRRWDRTDPIIARNFMPTSESHEITQLLLAWDAGDQTALDVSLETVKRDWRLAKAWLRARLSGEDLDEA